MSYRAFVLGVISTGVILIPSVLLRAGVVLIENATGDISIRVSDRDDIDIRSSSPGRETRGSDVAIEHKPGGIVVRCKPSDQAVVHVKLDVPYGTLLSVSTAKGAIAIEGMPASVDIKTTAGDLDLAVPWRATRLLLVAEEPPGEIAVPSGLRFRRESYRRGVKISDDLPSGHTVYGTIRVRTQSSCHIRLRDIPIPRQFPVKLHWQAPEVLTSLFTSRNQRRLRRRSDNYNENYTELPTESRPTFRTDVRLVDLLVVVKDKKGNAVTDLSQDDFELLEDGRPQHLRVFTSTKPRMNMVVLLDWSASTKGYRTKTQKAVQRFAEKVRSEDKIAVHLLFREALHIMSRLTDERSRLLRGIGLLEPLAVAESQANRKNAAGASPVYDVAMLAVADELVHLKNQINVLVAITDGIDNKSLLSFHEFRRAVTEMNVVVYPIVLDYHPLARVSAGGRSHPAKERIRNRVGNARLRLRQIARATGSRVFTAASLDHIDSVLTQIATELGSAYVLAYSPLNQDDNGAWRSVRVKVKRPDAVVRTRPGYFAR